MADNQRIEDLRRRVQKDPASIAFAQLAEECRRAGRYEEAVEVCRAGLAVHPGYLSARVTLGRALIELDQPDEALQALSIVLKSAPENLAAIRGTAEIHQRRGELAEALAQYRAALALARNDPDLQQTVEELARQVEPPKPPASADGLSFEDISSQFLTFAPPPAVPSEPPAVAEGEPPAADVVEPDTTEAMAAVEPPEAIETPADEPPAAAIETPADEPLAADATANEPLVIEPLVADTLAADAAPVPESPVVDAALSSVADPTDDGVAPDGTAQESAMRTVAALEQWLDAIHVTRAQRSS